MPVMARHPVAPEPSTRATLGVRYELKHPDGVLIGCFNDRQVAMHIAEEVLRSGPRELLLDSYDDAGRRVAEAIVRYRAVAPQPTKR
jgi:hypothetical protein